MKKKDYILYIEKPIDELKKELHDFREKLLLLQFDLAKGKVKNIREIKFIKKSIAQILTILKNKHQQ